MAKFGVFESVPPALFGTLSSMMATREKTALMSRKGTSTTIRFKKVVISRPDVSSLAFLL
jgi:hypothetical protein